MSDSNKISAAYVVKLVIAFLPWLISMYTLYWLEHDAIWTPETPHRGKTSFIILLVGMVLSFLLYTRLIERKKR